MQIELVTKTFKFITFAPLKLNSFFVFRDRARNNF